MKIKRFKEISKGHALIENPDMLVQFRDLLLQTARRSTLKTRDFLSRAAGRFGVGYITFNHSLERRNSATSLIPRLRTPSLVSTVAAARKVSPHWSKKTITQQCLPLFHCFTVRATNQLAFRVMRATAEFSAPNVECAPRTSYRN